MEVSISSDVDSVVEEAFQYWAVREDATTAETAVSHVQICREVYNHALT